jgi:hypothetical protein
MSLTNLPLTKHSTGLILYNLPNVNCNCQEMDEPENGLFISGTPEVQVVAYHPLSAKALLTSCKFL